jgi:hypothetical protein
VESEAQSTEGRVMVTRVIAKMKTIAERDYNDDLGSNILNIFHQLEDKEKELLIKTIFNHYYETNIFQEAAIKVMSDLDLDLKRQLNDLEVANRQELIKLKSWLVKASFIVIAAAAGVISAIIYFSTFKLESVGGGLGEFFKIIKIMLGL